MTEVGPHAVSEASNCLPGTVLFVIGSLHIGGAEKQMLLLAKGLCRQDVRCHVFTLDGSGPLRKSFAELGVPVSSMDFDRKAFRPWRALTLIRALVRLWRLSRQLRPDVLQAYLPLTSFLGAIAGRLAGVPLVVTCRRALGTHQDRHPGWWIFDRITNALSHAVLANSEAVALDVRRRDRMRADKIVLIRNGIDLASQRPSTNGGMRRELGLADGQIGIITVANLISYKGHFDLLNAMSGVRMPLVKLFLVGRDDGIGAQLRNRVRELGISEKVVFLGPRTDVPCLLRCMDVFVLPSHEEGSSNALIEAMACGMPIVATDVGGNPEVLSFGRFGLLVPARDPQALASAIERATQLGSPVLQKAREAVEFVRSNYSAAEMVRAHLEFYRHKLQAIESGKMAGKELIADTSRQ